MGIGDLDKSNKSFFPIFDKEVLVDESAVVAVLTVLPPATVVSMGMGIDGEEERPSDEDAAVVVVDTAVVAAVAAV